MRGAVAARAAQLGAQLGDGAHGLHARRHPVGGEPARRVGERVEQRELLGRALGDGRALALDGLLVAAGDRPGQRGGRAARRPVLDARAHERDERLAVDAGARGEALGQALERDEEVRGDRGGGVVGGAVLVGDVDGAHAERARRAPRRTRVRAASRRRSPRSRRRKLAPPSVTVMSGCRLKASKPPSGASVVAAEQWPASRPGRRGSAAAAAAICASGTHSSTASRSSGRVAPRPNGPSTCTPCAGPARRRARCRAGPRPRRRRGGQAPAQGTA